ncbi:MAG: SLC13 family permease [Bacteroidota bacterium]
MQLSINLQQNKAGLLSGIFLFLAFLFLPEPNDLSTAGWHTAAVAALMAVWWITEAIPISVTALLPIVLFPLLDITSISDTTAPYANPLIFLFLGGFVIAIAMQRWNLHRRIALNIIGTMGTKPSSVILGFILASAFLSMWVSNTATALMMLPIAVSVLQFVEQRTDHPESLANFGIVLMLSIAYGCNIGGVGTLIGTPPNALLAGFMLENYGIEISFSRWMMAGIPLVIILLPIVYLLLTRMLYPVGIQELPGGKLVIQNQLRKLGTLTTAEKRVAAVFITTAALWMFSPLLSKLIPGLSDAGIAITAAVCLFILPSGTEKGKPILIWDDLKELPWDILILFGGGLSLANGISSTGLADWIGEGVAGLDVLPMLLLILAVILIVVFLTEITSNTATAAAFLPILASTAVGIGQNPMLFIVPAAISTSCAFMLPVATPPNAIVYGSGRLSIPQMAHAGIWLNLAVSLILTLATYTLFAYVFGIEIGVLPEWVSS